jgi:hypothetical protein
LLPGILANSYCLNPTTIAEDLLANLSTRLPVKQAIYLVRPAAQILLLWRKRNLASFDARLRTNYVRQAQRVDVFDWIDWRALALLAAAPLTLSSKNPVLDNDIAALKFREYREKRLRQKPDDAKPKKVQR